MSIKAIQRRFHLVQYIQMLIAVMISAVAVTVFLAPFNIAPSGVTGTSVILNHVIGTPIGLVILILNIPIQILAYKVLPNSFRVVAHTLLVLLGYSLALDFVAQHIPTGGVSENVLLNAIFGGVLEGISSGLIIRAGGTFGGTSTLALILRRKFGMPMSTTLLYTDTLVICFAGLVFGWEAALFAIVMLFMSGAVIDYVLEGPSVIRTGVIITNQPEAVANAIIQHLGRGVTGWQATGMYTGQQRWVLYVSVARSEVNELRHIVATIDSNAFIVIGQGHTAYGEGFIRTIG